MGRESAIVRQLAADLAAVHNSQGIEGHGHRSTYVKVKVVGQANSVGPTSIEESFSLVCSSAFRLLSKSQARDRQTDRRWNVIDNGDFKRKRFMAVIRFVRVHCSLIQ